MSVLIKFRHKINTLWVKLIGDPLVFPLEYRIFHSICLVIIISLAYNVPFNFIIGLPVGASLDLIAVCTFLGFYYRSRYQGKMKGSIFIVSIICNILFLISYFYNSGISGPNDIGFAFSLFVIIFVTPAKQQKGWLAANIALLLVMHSVEYFYPQLAPYTYQTRLMRFINITSAYLVVAVLMYYTIKYIRRNYDYEKQQVDEKKDAIEDQHQYILVQNEQLEHLNSEKNKLMSIIAHDLRGPLGNIQNYLELVSEYGLEKEERQAVESDLLKVTQNTLNMLSKLLIWSKSQMDGVVVKLSDVNLNEALKPTLELERMLALKKGIILSCEIDPSIRVVADNDMLQLVVRNLVSNAIKFTPVGGSVDIRTQIVMNECKISIIDSGRGIPFEQQKDIFSLKAGSTFGTQNEKGVGLGLLLCKEFTEQQGGRIGFESSPGRGSAFFVYMPVG
ncbi:MAG: two-component sensor histidine kinase [Mucilaginibacter sp.]|nr:two-component sensor histidine kinase [Mucilaginibacter sp.]